jgi:putative DNA primase/helicase
MNDDDRTADEILDELEQDALDDLGDQKILPPPTDPMAVARQFIAEHHDDGGVQLLRWQAGVFYTYDGTCWPELDDRDLRSRIYKWTETAVFKMKTKAGTVLVPWQPNRHRVRDVFEAVQAVALLAATTSVPSWIVADGHPDATDVVSMGNGLLHLPSRKLGAHSPHFWVHHSLPFDYVRRPRQPRQWLRFLEELWEDDTESITTLQEMFGYVLSGSTRLQKMFLVVGPKRSGKGTIGRVLTGLLGRHNVAAPTLSGMTSDFGLAPLIDRPLALVSDARLSDKRDSSIVVERLLSVSGEDTLTINRKYKDHWTGRLPSRVVILTNELPHLSDSSGAFASRFIVLKLTKTFFGREDPRLTDVLLEEATGIFAWSLVGLDRLLERRYFVQPPSGAETVDELLDLASPTAMFIRERCEVGPQYETPVDAVYKAWRAWSEEKGYDRPGNVQVFGRDLRAVLPDIRIVQPRAEHGDRERRYAGIALRERGKQ